ncbi:MAG: mannose-6-phosphate isomerase, class I [Spirochaetaceae bacterium]|nr:mannose-6-phosphate isomerase, class I [Spirochaetaceae bacterium]
MLIHRLDNPVQRYAWGSRDGITKAIGIANPGGGPLAEVWMGAHPKAPSVIVDDEGERVGLDRFIARDPRRALGRSLVESRGETLSFLFKALSAGTPLSIQAHPSKRKAIHGFDRENLNGIPLDAPERNYRDPNHKPEMAVALTRFEMLLGFRPFGEIVDNLHILGLGRFDRVLRRLEKSPGRVELSVLFYDLLSLDPAEKLEMLAAARERVVQALGSGGLSAEVEIALRWTLRLMESFPGDGGAVAPLILNRVVLEPGRSIFIAPGELHAHLEGTCLEIMANSDNVLRGGLTGKHIDIPELVSVLSFNAQAMVSAEPEPVSPREEAYPVYAPDFRLSRVSLGAGQDYRRSGRSPEILLCAGGEASILVAGEGPLPLARGESVFVEAEAPEYEIESEGGALVYRASVPGA